MTKTDIHASQLIDKYLGFLEELNEIKEHFSTQIDKFTDNKFIGTNSNSDINSDEIINPQLELLFSVLKQEAFQNLKAQIEHLYAKDNFQKGINIIKYLELTGKNIFNVEQSTSTSPDDELPDNAISLEKIFDNLFANTNGCDIIKIPLDTQFKQKLADLNNGNTDMKQIIKQLNDKVNNSNLKKENSNSADLKRHIPDSITKAKINKQNTDINEKKKMQGLRYPDHSAYKFIIDSFKKRGITIQEMAQEAMEDQQKHGVHVKRAAYEKAIDSVIHKRDNMSLIMFGLAMDDLCTKKALPQPLQYIMDNDLSSLSTDELVGVCLSMPYSGIAVTNFGARDVHKNGLAKRLDQDIKHCNVFADDIVSALIGDAEAIVTHKYSF